MPEPGGYGIYPKILFVAIFQPKIIEYPFILGSRQKDCPYFTLYILLKTLISCSPQTNCSIIQFTNFAKTKKARFVYIIFQPLQKRLYIQGIFCKLIRLLKKVMLIPKVAIRSAYCNGVVEIYFLKASFSNSVTQDVVHELLLWPFD